MHAPTCPHCGAVLTRALDLPYGYWEWDGEGYVQRHTSEGVASPPFACAACLRGLWGFHPQDAEPRITIRSA